jgi:hypothetical protein
VTNRATRPESTNDEDSRSVPIPGMERYDQADNLAPARHTRSPEPHTPMPILNLDAVENRLRVDVRQLKRDGYLEPGRAERFWWRAEGELVGPVTVTAGTVEGGHGAVDIIGPDFAASVRLTTTPCTFGNRIWFTCPDCERRCAVLLVETGSLTCQQCANAPNLSTTLSRAARKQDELHKARRGLFMDEHDVAHRPKGMRSATWQRRWDRYWRAVEALLSEESQRQLDQLRRNRTSA